MRILARLFFVILFCIPSTFAQWTQTSLDSGFVTALFSEGTTLFAGTDTLGVFQSTDQGATWVQDNSGLPDNEVVYCFDQSGGNIFMGKGGYMYRTTAAGTGWTPSSTGMTDTQHVYAIGGGAGNVYMSMAGGFYRSITDGASWTKQGSDQGINCILVVGNEILGGTYGGWVIRSTDHGVNWSRADTGVTAMTNYDLIAVGSTIFLASYDGVFRTTNAGSSWTASNNGLTSPSIRSFALSGTTLFAATGTGVFRTTDMGENWVDVSEGLLGVYFGTYLTIDGSYLYMGGSSGVWRRALSEIVTSVDQTAAIPSEELRLESSYPNPFNSSTQVRFSLPTRSFVRLAIIDLLGREVARIADEELEKGTYVRTWNAGNSAGGMYMCRMDAGGSVKVRRMVLVK